MANGIGDGKVGTTLIIGGAGSGGLPGTFTVGNVPPTPPTGAIATAAPQAIEVRPSDK